MHQTDAGGQSLRKLLLALPLAVACVGAEPLPTPPAATCPVGQARGFGDACAPLGIQGCADVFLDAEGLCRPALERCNAGRIPKFDEGCIAVGVPACHATFVDAEGTCAPKLDACPPNTFPLPGEGCVPIDGPDGCGDGAWGSLADEPGTTWVDPGAPEGGDGTRDLPLRTLAEGLAKAAPGGRVALAAGTYAEPAVIDKPVELVGRCASMVRIEGTTPFSGGPVTMFVSKLTSKESVTVRGVTLGSQGSGLVTNARVTLDNVGVDGAAGFGVVVIGDESDVVLRRTLVRNTQATSPDYPGRGAMVLDGGSLTVIESALLGNRDMGLYASDAGTRLTLTRSLATRTLGHTKDELDGQGLHVTTGAEAEVQDSTLDRNRIQAVDVQHGASLRLVRSLVSRTNPTSDGGHGRGLSVDTGASALIEASAFLENGKVSVLAMAGQSLRLDASLVDATRPNADGSYLGIPHLEFTIEPTRRDETTARPEGKSAGRPPMPTKDVARRARREIPQAHVAIHPGRCEELPVAGEGDEGRLVGVATQHAQRPGRDGEHIDGAVLRRRREQLAVGRERHAVHDRPEVTPTAERLVAQRPPERAGLGRVALLERVAQSGSRFEQLAPGELARRRGELGLGALLLGTGALDLRDPLVFDRLSPLMLGLALEVPEY
ncbi:MAG: hypothetical protein FJ096_20645, partial [Deltaproteobacteria bacterium]|nr:hypothetical protein [Deltaproteobacteria bacterium]